MSGSVHQWVLVLSLFVGGCTGDPELHFGDGERLEARYHEVEGFYVFDAWFDRAFAEPCRWSLEPRAGGSYRCVPEAWFSSAASEAEWVRGSLEVIEAEDGYGVALMRGEDGSFQRLGTYDVAQTLPVQLAGSLERQGFAWWAPVFSWPSEGIYFTDSQCMGRAAVAYVDLGEFVAAVGDDRGYFGVGDLVSRDVPLFRLDDVGRCQDAEQLPPYYEVRTVTRLVTARRGRFELVGDGRIREAWEATAEGRLVARAGFLVDTERDVNCRPFGNRCLPIDAPLNAVNYDDYAIATAHEGTPPSD